MKTLMTEHYRGAMAGRIPESISGGGGSPISATSRWSRAANTQAGATSRRSSAHSVFAVGLYCANVVRVDGPSGSAPP